MNIINIIEIVTAIVIWGMGIVTKYYTKIANKRIPIQSLAIGTLSFLVSAISIKTGMLELTYSTAALICFGTVAGATGTYNIVKAVLQWIWDIIKDTRLITYLRKKLNI